MKILNFGSCNIDYVYSLDHIVEAGETEASERLDVFPGGKGLNQSIAIARAGGKVYHAGCVGFDGDMLTEVLEQSGVDVSFIKKTSEKNGHAIIEVSSDGENSIFLYPGSNHLITEDYIDSVLENFESGDIILLQNEINCLDLIVEKAYKKGMCIVLNPSPIDKNLDSVDFGHLTYIILNKIEAKAVSGCERLDLALAKIKEKYPNLKVVLTLGQKGSVFLDGQNEWRQAAFKVQAVDTTAACDTFTGYFVAGICHGIETITGYFIAELSRGAEPQTALKTASLAAAISVSKMGAAPSIPWRDEVLEAYKTFSENSVDERADEARRKLDDYLDRNLQTAELRGLAEQLGYSAVYTGSYIKKLTGRTFSELLLDKRCTVAAKMLSETDLSVGEIIAAVGYQNENFFRKAFRQKYGKNPLEYRKKGVK